MEPVYRDPADIATLQKVSAVTFFIAILLGCSLIGNAVQYWRRPDRIVVVKSADSSERVVMLNDRVFGEADGVQLTPDKLDQGDKIYLAKTFTSLFYGINPARRAENITEAFSIFHPKVAAQMLKSLEEKRTPQLEKEESHQAVWALTGAEVDSRDPYLVTLSGKQELTRNVGGNIRRDANVIQVKVKLMADPRGRDDANKRSGLQIIGVSEKVLSTNPF